MPLTSNLFVPRPVMVWKQMVPLLKKISAPNLSHQSAPNTNLNLVCIHYFGHTCLWDGFLFHRSQCFAISPSQLKVLAVPCVPQCCCTPVLYFWACRELPLLLWVLQVPSPTPVGIPLRYLMYIEYPAQAVPAHLSSEQSVLCWLSLRSLPSCPVCWCLCPWAAQHCS